MNVRIRAGVILRDYQGKSWFLIKSKQDAMRAPLTLKQARAVIYVYEREKEAKNGGRPFVEWPFGIET